MPDAVDRLNAALADRYAIERELGRGGMAIVYLAHDRKLKRQVALKVLRPELAASLGGDRFVREIEIAAQLTHPNIIALHDCGGGDECLYYTMPIVEGESLRTKLDREGQLGVDVVCRLAEDVGAALEYAHKQGVIHRDIKPENILFHHGVPMVADFGIALAVQEAGGERLTEMGISVGTPQYMSPEQVSGDRKLDARSDVYALGCVLYEALVGEPPFTGPSAMAVMARQVTDPVRPITTVRPDVPVAMVSAVTRALAKAPADRFDSAGTFAVALKAQEPGPSPVAIHETPDVDARRCIAVLPFSNLSTDPENDYFSDGITEDIITQLSKISAFKVISRSSSMRYRQTEKTMREIADELGVGMLLEGSVRRAGGNLRITARLIEAESDAHLWAEAYDRELTDVFAIQTDVAFSVASALQTALTPGEQARIEARPTDNMRAYDLCLLGRHHAARLTAEGLTQAIEYFEKALEHDPAYAAAYAGLADAHALSAIGYRPVEPRDALGQAKDAVFRAIELDETLAEAHAPLGHIYAWFEFKWDDAKREFERAVELNPSSVQAHQYYGQYFLPMRDYDSAYVELKRALELDPLSVVLTTELCWPPMYAGDQERAREQVLKALEMDPLFPLAHFNLAQTYHFQGRYLEAIPIYEKAVELSGGVWFIRSYLAGAYVAAGQKERAEAIGAELLEDATHGMGLELGIAMVHDVLGRSSAAMDWLERAFEARSPMLSAIGLDVMPFNSVRDDPRFHRLLEKMRLGGRR